MNTKKYLLIVALMVALVALAGLGADVAEAGGIGKTAPTHPPVCSKVLYSDFTGSYYELQCTDSGNDIIGVYVKATVKYTLDWDASTVTLRVPTQQANDQAVYLFWQVSDQAGARVSGTLP